MSKAADLAKAAGVGVASSVAIISEQKAAGNHGSAMVAATWNVREINTEDSDPDGIVSIASNQFTLGAGTYIVEWSASGYDCNQHKTRLYDITNSQVAKVGSNSYSQNTYNIYNLSVGMHRLVLTSSTTYELQHYSNAAAGVGFGVLVSQGPEVYSQIKITKVV